MKILLFFCFLSSTLSAASLESWWTGSLLSSSAVTVPVGSSLFEPYLFYTNFYGGYDKNWSLSTNQPTNSIGTFLYSSTGLTERIEISFIAQAFYNFKESKSFVGFGDSSCRLGFQICKETKDTPAIKLTVGEIFPTGNYHHLDPNLEAIDAAGAGSFQTLVGLRVQKQVEISPQRHLRWRININYTLPCETHIVDKSVYGGGPGTHGTVRPGNEFSVLGAIELQLDQNWVFSCDTLYDHNNRSTFSGTTLLPVGTPSSEQFSVAPAIEYNFNKKIGIIAGVWATVAGRNCSAFYSPTIAVNILF